MSSEYQMEARSSVTITQKKKNIKTRDADVEASVVIKQYYDGTIQEAIKIVDDWDNRRYNKDVVESKSLKSNEPTEFNTTTI